MRSCRERYDCGDDPARAASHDAAGQRADGDHEQVAGAPPQDAVATVALGSGGDRRPAWWRRAAVLGALVAVAVAAVLATGQPRQWLSLAVGSEAPTGTTSDRAGRSPLDRSTGSVLYLADPAGSVRVLDVDRGVVGDELPLRPAQGDQPFLLSRVGQAAVLLGDDGHVHAFGGGLPDVIDLGRSALFLPAPPDGLWLVAGDRQGREGDLRMHQVDLADARFVAPTPVPPGQTPVAAQGDRVLLEGDDALRWWTPLTGEGLRIAGRRGLAAGQTVAVVCDAPCRTVDVLHRDGTRAARLRMAETVTAAVVAPDERAVALLTQTELATAGGRHRRPRRREHADGDQRCEGRGGRPWADVEPGWGVVVLPDVHRSHRRRRTRHRPRQRFDAEVGQFVCPRRRRRRMTQARVVDAR